MSGYRLTLLGQLGEGTVMGYRVLVIKWLQIKMEQLVNLSELGYGFSF